MKQIFILLIIIVGKPLFAQKRTVNFYREQELLIPVEGGVSLSGTLTTPDSRDSNHLVAVIVAGSGPTDRDGNQAGIIYPNTYRFLAHDLAQKGVSIFRYDKRGVAASARPGSKEYKLTFDNYIQDLVACISYLRERYHFRRAILIGHSEGALISFIAGKKAQADGYIAIGAPGSPIDTILLGQIKERMPLLSAKAGTILSKLRNKETVDTVPRELTALFRHDVQPFLITMMAYDPSREIAAIDAPVLIIQGDNDLQIKMAETHKLIKAKPAAMVAIIQHMNHVLKISEQDNNRNIQLYNSPAIPISAAVAEHINIFLRKNNFMK